MYVYTNSSPLSPPIYSRVEILTPSPPSSNFARDMEMFTKYIINQFSDKTHWKNLNTTCLDVKVTLILSWLQSYIDIKMYIGSRQVVTTFI